MHESDKKHGISSLAPLILFLIFASCVAIVLLFGARAYQRFLDRNEATYDRRTTVQYLTTAVRKNDGDHLLFVGDFHEGEAQSSGDTLYLCEDLGDTVYYTRIYCYDGYIRELFTDSESEFAPEDGSALLEAQALSFETCDDLLQIHILYGDGTEETLLLQLRSRTEGVE